MKVFVLGSNGMLGNYVDKYFYSKKYNAMPFTRKNLDASTASKASIRSSMLLKEDDVVINCVGLIKQRSEATRLDFIKVNAVFPQMLFAVCKEVGAKLIHVSTDCVYSGKTGGYDENSVHDARDDYGLTKSLGEPEDCTVIRTSIIGEETSNFLSLLEWVKSKRGLEVNGFTNHFWNGITCLQFAKICEQIIKEDIFWAGVKHVFSPQSVSKYELIKLISKVYDLNIKVNEYSSGEKCDRTLTTVRNGIILQVPDLEEQLIELRNFKF